VDELGEWYWGGLTDPKTETHEHPFPSWGIEVFEQMKLDAKHDRLLWNRSLRYRIAPPSDLLTRFVALGVDGQGQSCAPSGDAILAFARAYGPLNVWPDLWPILPSWKDEFLEMKRSLPRGFSMAEPLEHWRHYTAAMRAVLGITALVRQGKEVPRTALDALRSPHEDDPRYTYEADAVFWVINTWILYGGVRPLIRPDLTSKGNARAYLDAHSTFGVLTVQLLQAVSATSGWTFCCSCSAMFTIPRGTRGRPPIYCKDCGPKARRRLAARRHYHKKREETRKSEARHERNEASRKP
jgi:hypothetical protein